MIDKSYVKLVWILGIRHNPFELRFEREVSANQKGLRAIPASINRPHTLNRRSDKKHHLLGEKGEAPFDERVAQQHQEQQSNHKPHPRDGRPRPRPRPRLHRYGRRHIRCAHTRWGRTHRRRRHRHDQPRVLVSRRAPPGPSTSGSSAARRTCSPRAEPITTRTHNAPIRPSLRYVTRAGLETKKGIAEPPRVLTCLPAHRTRPPGTPPRLLERREQLVGLPSWRGKGEQDKRDYGEVDRWKGRGKGREGGRDGMGRLGPKISASRMGWPIKRP